VSGTSGCPAWDNNEVVFFYGINDACTWTIPAGYAVTTTVGFVEPDFDYITFNYDATHYDSNNKDSIPVVVGPATIYFSSDLSTGGNFRLTASVFIEN